MAWDKTKPANDEKLVDAPAQIRANWDAIELGTDSALQITNAKVSASAAIADTKLAQITTASKVSGAALTSLGSIPSSASGQIPVANGGTAASTAQGAINAICGTSTQGDILYFNGTNWVHLAAGTANNALLTGGAGANPAWGNPTNLNISGQAQGDILYYNGSAWVRLAAGTSGHFLKTQGAGANPTWVANAMPTMGSLSADLSAAGDRDDETAATDLIITVLMAVAYAASNKWVSYGSTGASSPSTLRAGCFVDASLAVNGVADYCQSYSFTVKAGEHWSVSKTQAAGSGSTSIFTVYARPIS